MAVGGMVILASEALGFQHPIRSIGGGKSLAISNATGLQ
jgi:hypothetical protein